jgi:hypothetical protein
MIVPPIRPRGPTDFIEIDPRRVFPDGGPGERPEMAPPVDIGEILMDLGELAPSKYPPLVEMSERGTKKITYFDNQGNPIATVYVFPDKALFANDPFFSETRHHERMARSAEIGENYAKAVVILSDIGLTLGGVRGVKMVIYVGGRAFVQGAVEADLQGKEGVDIIKHAGKKSLKEAAMEAILEGSFAGLDRAAAKGVDAAGQAAARAEAGERLARDTAAKADALLSRAGAKGASRAERAAVRREAAAQFVLPKQALRKSKRGARKLGQNLSGIRDAALDAAQAARSGPVQQARNALAGAQNAELAVRSVNALSGASVSIATDN